MKKYIIICGLLIATLLASCAFEEKPVENSTTAPVTTTEPEVTTTEPKPTISTEGIETELILEVGDIYFISLDNVDATAMESVVFSSNNESVATVDDSGRVDAVSVGNTDILIKYYDQELTCNVEVIDAEEEALTYSTAYVDNQGILENNINTNYGSQYIYSIDVIRNQNTVNVYTYDENGEYTVPVRAMVCSSGLDGATITGDFSIYYNTTWNPLYGNVYGKYTSGFSGDYLFHSVPFYQASSDTLKTEEYNKLGDFASMGCIRMAVADTKWLMDNCPVGTPVYVFDDDTPGPLGKPESMHITDLDNGWDPTDDHPDNPYNLKKPVINGAKDITINKGESVDLLNGVTAVDTCDNSITDKITVNGYVYNNKAGQYKISYMVTDAMYRSDRVDITVTVN